ncbi:hypothetical protein DEU56DRAFT_800934, partial [Suillus clintonianus]|uniref:uncharacterized protein n=1 Tax=Suillus clintonianus TaxID=1904413 RepID=UPI001B873A84
MSYMPLKCVYVVRNCLEYDLRIMIYVLDGCGSDAVGCGNSVIGCGNSVIGCGNSVIGCGNSVIGCGNSVVGCGSGCALPHHCTDTKPRILSTPLAAPLPAAARNL